MRLQHLPFLLSFVLVFADTVRFACFVLELKMGIKESKRFSDKRLQNVLKTFMAVIGASLQSEAFKTGGNAVQIYLSFRERYNHLMKLLLTILLGLLLVQAVVGLHLHTEEEGSGNVTANEDVNATANVAGEGEGEHEEEERLQRIQKIYNELETSGDEEIVAEAKEAKEKFEAKTQEIKKKIEEVGQLSEDATITERLEAFDKIEILHLEFKESVDELEEKLDELKLKLEEKNAASSE